MLLNTGSDVYKYFMGNWSITRKIDYKCGGMDGFERSRYIGKASFLPINILNKNLSLLYSEEGRLIPESGGNSLNSSRYYLFWCGNDITQVYFMERPDGPCGEFFHSLDFTKKNNTQTCSEFQHMCSQDSYKGSYCIVSENSFICKWLITGPKKDGTIESYYERVLNNQHNHASF